MEAQTPNRNTGATPPIASSRIRWLVTGAVVLVLAVFAFFLLKARTEEIAASRWDEYDRLVEQYEPPQDPLFEDPNGDFRARRDQFMDKLDEFLVQTAESEDDALAPHVHWMIAKLASDQLLSMQDVVDFAKRAPYYDRATKHLEIIRDKYPAHPLNWTMFQPEGYPTLTRMFLAKLAENRAWEEKHLPRPKAPPADPVVVVRTTRGDIRFGLYQEEAPAATKLFLQRARGGYLDGTAFYARSDTSSGPGAARNATIRGGNPETRGATAYDKRGHLKFTDAPTYEPILPARSRSLIPHERGVVSAWHDPADSYDGSQEVLIVVRPSPELDYDYSPIGKVLDDKSLATVDRIFEQDTWRKDDEVMSDTGELRRIADFLQAPVRIVKVLVYEGGKLLPAPDGASPDRGTIQDSETSLDTLVPDEYLEPVPERPTPGD